MAFKGMWGRARPESDQLCRKQIYFNKPHGEKNKTNKTLILQTVGFFAFCVVLLKQMLHLNEHGCCSLVWVKTIHPTTIL